MMLEILRSARYLDKRLEAAVGRPYRVLISAALIAEVAGQIRDLTRASFSRAHFVQTLIWITIGILVVINQLGELSRRLEERKTRTAQTSTPPARSEDSWRR